MDDSGAVRRGERARDLPRVVDHAVEREPARGDQAIQGVRSTYFITMKSTPFAESTS